MTAPTPPWVALHAQRSGRPDRIADAITAFSGSMTFVYVHLVWFSVWIVANTAFGPAFDPFPFGLLTMIVSLEAIFLSTFVLLSQNRQADRAAVRNRIEFETDVQADVWSEMIAEKLGVDPAEVQRRVQARLDDATRQAGDDGNSGRASAPQPG
jgi:uncharacterized membrane protein